MGKAEKRILSQEAKGDRWNRSISNKADAEIISSCEEKLGVYPPGLFGSCSFCY